MNINKKYVFIMIAIFGGLAIQKELSKNHLNIANLTKEINQKTPPPVRLSDEISYEGVSVSPVSKTIIVKYTLLKEEKPSPYDEQKTSIQDLANKSNCAAMKAAGIERFIKNDADMSAEFYNINKELFWSQTTKPRTCT